MAHQTCFRRGFISEYRILFFVVIASLILGILLAFRWHSRIDTGLHVKQLDGTLQELYTSDFLTMSIQALETSSMNEHDLKIVAYRIEKAPDSNSQSRAIVIRKNNDGPTLGTLTQNDLDEWSQRCTFKVTTRSMPEYSELDAEYGQSASPSYSDK